MKKQWTLFNALWLIAFIILLSYLMRIALIGFAFLIVAGSFLWLLYRSKSEAPWVTWIIPYFLSIIFFLWFFSGENFINFLFHNFWFSLKEWFSYPFLPAGFTIILAIISYFVIYLVSVNIKKAFNSSIILAVTAAITGIVSQFIDPFVTFGMAILFIFAIVLNSIYDGTIHRSTLKMIGIILIAFLAVFFMTLTARPVSPLENAFTSLSTSSASTTNASPSKILVHIERIPISHSNGKISSTFNMDWIYNILLYVVGTFSIAVSGILIYFFIKYREKNKKQIKNLLTVIWMIISILFIFISVLYFIGISKPSTALPLKVPEMKNGVTYIASTSNIATPIKVANYSIPPFFFLVLLAIAGSVFIMIIYNVFKYGIPFEKAEENFEKRENFEFKKENLNFSGPPDKTVLFYYNLLRKKIGDPSLTPYEFADYLNKYVEQNTSQRITEIFVKLRYARKKITDEESQFFKETIISILNSL